ncbi:MAG: hypothetical protein JKP95_02270 [Oceanicaulis sp.]|nr:hypothetical protein [Oceanicaulis sp.]
MFGGWPCAGALAWLVMTAVILLFFVESTPALISATALGLALLAAVYAFASTIGPVVRKCSGVRDETLKEVRERIQARASAMMGERSDEASPVSELIAYEAWLEKLPVWPISAPVTGVWRSMVSFRCWPGSARRRLNLFSTASPEFRRDEQIRLARQGFKVQTLRRSPQAVSVRWAAAPPWVRGI